MSLDDYEKEWCCYWFFDIDTNTLTEDYMGDENGFEIEVFPHLEWGSCETNRRDRDGAPIGEACPVYEYIDWRVANKKDEALAEKYGELINSLIDKEEEKYVKDIEMCNNIILDHA